MPTSSVSLPFFLLDFFLQYIYLKIYYFFYIFLMFRLIKKNIVFCWRTIFFSKTHILIGFLLRKKRPTTRAKRANIRHSLTPVRSISFFIWVNVIDERNYRLMLKQKSGFLIKYTFYNERTCGQVNGQFYRQMDGLWKF